MAADTQVECSTEAMSSLRSDRSRPEDHLGLVRSMVNWLHPFSESDADDMYSDGVLGLLHAFEGYDEAHGTTRSTYLAHRIRGSILDGRRNRDPLGRNIRVNVREIERVRSVLRSELGRTPLECEVRAAVDLTAAQYRRATDADRASQPASLDAVIGVAESGATLADVFAEEPDDDEYEAETAREDASRTVRRLIATLSGRSRHVVVRRYLHGDSVAVIAADLGVTESRVSQILARALEAMRNPDTVKSRRIHRKKKVGPASAPVTEPNRTYLARVFGDRLTTIGLDRTPHAMSAFRFGLGGGSKVNELASATGVTRRSWSRRLAVHDLAGPQHWIMAGRITWWLYLLEHRYTTVRGLAKAVGVGEYDISHICYAATGMRPGAMVEACSQVASPAPLVDAMVTYLTERQCA